MHGHLVTVEVGVEGRTNERMKLDGFAFNENRLESLNAQAVKGRSTVQQNRMFLNDFFKDIPHLGTTTFDHALGRLDVLRKFLIDQTLHDEWLEKFERHQLRQTTLMQLEGRTDDDDRAARVVDTLPEKVLTEASLLTLEHVGERLERTVARTRYGAATTAVVEQCVDRFLQHTLFVVDDDLRCTEIEKSLEAVVSVYYAAIEIVEVRRRKTATV